MKKVKTFSFTVFLLMFLIPLPDKILSQNFSNLGKDFWVGHMGHTDWLGSYFKFDIL